MADGLPRAAHCHRESHWHNQHADYEASANHSALSVRTSGMEIYMSMAQQFAAAEAHQRGAAGYACRGRKTSWTHFQSVAPLGAWARKAEGKIPYIFRDCERDGCPMGDNRISMESTTGAKRWESVPIITLAPKLGMTLKHAYWKGGRKPVTHCKRNHEMTEANTYWDNRRRRGCRTCKLTRAALLWRNGDRQNKARRNAPGSRQEARSADHASRHQDRSGQGSPWRQTGQFRSHGEKTFPPPR
jgi:uncharacterized protein (DUF2147 family)